MENKRFLTTEEAAEYLGVTPFWLRRVQREGVSAPPYIQFGPRKTRYDVNDLEAWVNKNKKGLESLVTGR